MKRIRKPRIGVVGENYVRLHDVANNHLVRHLESLGAETSVASLLEYLLYCNWTRMNMARRDRSPKLWTANLIQDRVQRSIARKINAPFRKLLGNVDEPSTRALVNRAARFIDPAFEGGETVLCAAKTIEMHEHGMHGVISVMPFGCMPTTIFAGLTKSIAQHIGRMPILNTAYDGQQDATLHTRLEAFVHQARNYQEGGAPNAVRTWTSPKVRHPERHPAKDLAGAV